MCFVWISEQTAIISLYNINLAVFKTETECLLRGTKWTFKSARSSFVLKGLKKPHCVSTVPVINQHSSFYTIGTSIFAFKIKPLYYVR